MARKIKLTKFGIDALTPNATNYVVWDEDTKHLALRVTPKGHKSFIVQRRIGKRGKMVIRTIGTYPDISLADARKEADEIVRQLRGGVDPKAVEHAREIEEEVRKANTFGVLANDFIRRHVSKLRSARNIEGLIKRDLKSRWDDKPLMSITRKDATKLIDAIADSGRQPYARKVLAVTHKLFNWAIDRDTYGIETNPCARVKVEGTPNVGSRVLSDDELRIVWAASNRMSLPFGALVRVLLLTGQRLREISDARWDEIEGDVLTVPGERMKGKQSHSIPLTPTVMAILDAIPRFKDCPFVFTSLGKIAFCVFSSSKRKFDAMIETVIEEERAKGREVRDMPKWTLHDLRRTARTRLSSLGVMPLVSELVIGHRQKGIHAVYDRYTYDREKRDALTRWEKCLLGIVEPKAPKSNVVKIRRA